MSRWSMTNGSKATAVTVLGFVALLGVIALACLGKISAEVVAASLLANFGNAMGFLTGASAPDGGQAIVYGPPPRGKGTAPADQPSPAWPEAPGTPEPVS